MRCSMSRTLRDAVFGAAVGDALAALEEDDIASGGYVVDTLEAALWCLLHTDNYADCVLRAVNLGRDTDTTACVAGALAGIVYGEAAIPPEWLETLCAKEVIENTLFNDFPFGDNDFAPHVLRVESLGE